MKEFISTTIKAGGIFGAIMSVFFIIMYGLTLGLLCGIFAGLLFGVVIAGFINIQSKKFRKLGLEITGGKEIVHDGGANHFVGKEGVGGWIYITKEHVIFQSHNFNVNKHKWMEKITDIQDVYGQRTKKIIDNGLVIVTGEGKKEEFVVNKRDEWVSVLNDLMESTRNCL